MSVAPNLFHQTSDVRQRTVPVRRHAERRLLPAAASTVLLALSLALFGAPGFAAAGPSPGIAPSKISIDEPVRQGDDVRLGLRVSNRGDEAGMYSIDLFGRSNQEELAPDATWFEFTPATFRLEPAETQDVSVLMQVPRDAEPGDYLAFLRTTAQTVETTAQPVGVSAAVASTLSFSVKNRNFHFYDPVTDFFTDRAPFSYIGVALLVGLVVLVWVRQRYQFRISLGAERRE